MQHNKKLTHLAQELRNGMTREEKQLWYRFLRQYPIQFKRQVTCGAYILDFYCPQAKLAIELDGSYHKHSAVSENDKTRDEYLVSNGIYVMRFPNRDIWHDFDRVRKQIDYVVKVRNGTSSTARRFPSLACGLGHVLALASLMQFTTKTPLRYPKGNVNSSTTIVSGGMKLLDFSIVCLYN